MSEHMSPIPSRIYNAAVGGHVCGPEDVDFGQKVIHLIKYDKDGNEVSFESQVTQANKVYVIHDDFTLTNNVTVPANCVLDFDGGSVSGAYTLTGTNTYIQAGLVKIFNTDVTLAGTWNVAEAYPEWFGAKGDGITNDTAAIQKTFNSFGITEFGEYKEYYINTTLTLPRNKSINGKRAKIYTDSNFVESNIGPSVPSTTLLYIQGREPIQHSEKIMNGSFIKDLKIFGIEDSVGIFLGTEDKDAIEQATNVNYSVSGYEFSNINIDECNTGVWIQDCWDCHFTDILVRNSSQYGIYIKGQVVNCCFDSCRCYCDGSENSEALHIEQTSYNGNYRRPEGCSFNGGFYGSAHYSVNVGSGLAIYFSNCIFDLSTIGIRQVSTSDLSFISCWIYGVNTSGGIGVLGEDISTIENYNSIRFVSCHIIAYKPLQIGANQRNIVVSKCEIIGTVNCTFDSTGTFVFVDNFYSSDNVKLLLTNQKENYVLSGNIIKGISTNPANLNSLERKANIYGPLAASSGSYSMLKIKKTFSRTFLVHIGFVAAYQSNETLFYLKVGYDNVPYIVPISLGGSVSFNSVIFKTDSEYFYIGYTFVGGLKTITILETSANYSSGADDVQYIPNVLSSDSDWTALAESNIIEGSVFNNYGTPSVYTSAGVKAIALQS